MLKDSVHVQTSIDEAIKKLESEILQPTLSPAITDIKRWQRHTLQAVLEHIEDYHAVEIKLN